MSRLGQCNTHTRYECSRITEDRSENKIYTLTSRLTNALAEAVNHRAEKDILSSGYRSYFCSDMDLSQNLFESTITLSGLVSFLKSSPFTFSW
jgi:hypothetical protein